MTQDDADPVRESSIPVPVAFIAEGLAQLDSAAEIKAILRVHWLLSTRPPDRRFVSAADVEARTPEIDDPPGRRVAELLAAAVGHGLLISAEVAINGIPANVWTSPLDRALLDSLKSEGVIGAVPEPGPPLRDRLNIFEHYENNIGLLTATVADRLKDAEQTYPPSWIEEAIDEAAIHNARNWAYIEAILRRWAEKGRDDGEPEGHPEPIPNAVDRFGGHYKNIFR